MPSYNMQTAYPATFPKGIHGQIASEEKYNAVSFSVQTAAGLKFGAPAGRGTVDKTCVLYAEGGDFVGLAVLDPTPEFPQPGSADIVDGFPQHATAALMTEGSMYGRTNAAVTAGGAVFFDAASNSYGTAGLEIPGAIYDTSAAANGIVEISLGHRVA